MTTTPLTITVIFDKSGSMMRIWDTSMKALKDFILEQRQLDQNNLFSLIMFNNKVEYVFKHKKLEDVDTSVLNQIRPRSSTALNDAIGQAIDDIEAGLTYKGRDGDGRLVERKNVLVILTDGFENASEKYTREDIRRKIESHKDWDVIYLGANQDAIYESQKYGVSRNNTLTFAAEPCCMPKLMASVSDSLRACSQGAAVAFSEKQRFSVTR